MILRRLFFSPHFSPLNIPLKITFFASFILTPLFSSSTSKNQRTVYNSHIHISCTVVIISFTIKTIFPSYPLIAAEQTSRNYVLTHVIQLEEIFWHWKLMLFCQGMLVLPPLHRCGIWPVEETEGSCWLSFDVTIPITNYKKATALLKLGYYTVESNLVKDQRQFMPVQMYAVHPPGQTNYFSVIILISAKSEEIFQSNCCFFIIETK